MKIIKKKAVGLDIADNLLAISLVEKKGKSFDAVHTFSASLDPGIVVKGRIKKREEFKNIFKQFIESAEQQDVEMNNIIFGVPDQLVYTHVFKTDETDKKKYKDLVLKEIEDNIPLKSNNIILEYVIRNGDETELLVISADKKALLDWREFFTEMKLDVDTYDLETMAIARSIFKKLPDVPTCILDIDGSDNTISVFDSNGLRYAYSFGAKADNLDTTITKKCKETFSFVKSEYNKDIKEVFLVGEPKVTSKLAKLLTKELGITVGIGKSACIEDLKSYYIESVGLAIRGIDGHWSAQDVTLSIPKSADRSTKKKMGLKSDKRVSKKTITLVVILLASILLLVSAFWYRSGNKTENVIEDDQTQEEINLDEPIESLGEIE